MNETLGFASIPKASFFLKKKKREARNLDDLLFKYGSKYLCFLNL